MPTKTKTPQADAKPKRAGRPPAGVTKDNANTYWRAINNWIRQLRLDHWLEEGKIVYEAEQAMKKLSPTDKDLAAKLTVWCQEWLSEKGWKRLQANARQTGYVRGYQPKAGENKSRSRKKNLQVDERAIVRLGLYAKSHNVTLSEALTKLLDEEEVRDRKELHEALKE